MELNVKSLMKDIKKLTGYTGRGAISQLAMQCKILPATLYNLEKSGKDFSVSTLIRLVRGSGAQWQEIGALLEKHYRD